MFSFFEAFTASPILYSVIGAAAGIIWGAIPGLSMTMGIALLATFSYSMSIFDAAAFLMGVYTGATFGGAVSAVLINIPGTPDSVPIQLAGYPLTKRGRGGEAIATAIFASFVGNWVGILILALTAPLLIMFALEFGAWEQFLLALCGILLAGSISGEGDSAIKGWISGWIGLAISMVGLEPILGYPRLVFDVPNLRGGVDFIAALIGLFGIAEVMRMAGQKNPRVSRMVIGRCWPRFDLLRKYAGAALRSSGLGTVIGVIPGGGSPMANFLSYELGQRISGKDFSKGSIEGVVCTGTSDNASIGGSLLPALALGIPSSAAVAVFMAALAYHGVVVGPSVELSQPGFLSYLYGTLIVANFAMYVLAFLLLKPIMKMLALPPSVLMPMVAMLCMVGAYSVQLSVFDMWIALAFGLFGYVMSRSGFPLAPMVFAMILGKLADENLRKAVIIFKDDALLSVFSRPVGLVIIAVIVLIVGFGLKRSLDTRAGRKSRTRIAG
ncbi:tripartite tricarboxylate transporter permease [Nitratireductor sp.]|uniref:tripartite tricarboxylate transporter permease n=1 Tax=Nitratireductor sp. TaxID=1872084 RepID=UPI0025F6EAD7|nr:tripartite tricarboxylate transporter permease [Nitratireductor sp.]